MRAPLRPAGAPPATLGPPRDEVLDHLGYCVDVARTEVDLEERFGWEYIDHAEADGVVTVTIRGSDGRIERLTTKRLIKAYGNHACPARRCRSQVRPFARPLPRN